MAHIFEFIVIAKRVQFTKQRTKNNSLVSICKSVFVCFSRRRCCCVSNSLESNDREWQKAKRGRDWYACIQIRHVINKNNKCRMKNEINVISNKSWLDSNWYDVCVCVRVASVQTGHLRSCSFCGEQCNLPVTIYNVSPIVIVPFMNIPFTASIPFVLLEVE